MFSLTYFTDTIIFRVYFNRHLRLTTREHLIIPDFEGSMSVTKINVNDLHDLRVRIYDLGTLTLICCLYLCTGFALHLTA